jgi:hypothetical protein
LRLRCGDSIRASAIGIGIPSKRPNEMWRSLGCALVPDVNLAGVNFEGAHLSVPALWRLRAVSTRLTVKDFRALASGKLQEWQKKCMLD